MLSLILDLMIGSLSRFINIVMNDGKKSTAEKIVYNALDIASSKVKGKKPNRLIQECFK